MKRFWDKVDKSSGKCWNWTAYKNEDGYGTFKFEDKVFKSHRFSWMLHNGKIPNKMQVLHSCDNPSCVNPYHLFLGNHLDNMRDKVKKGRVGNRIGLCAGEKHGLAKLKESDIREIRTLYAKGDVTQVELSRRYNICFGSISKIIRLKRWRHIK